MNRIHLILPLAVAIALLVVACESDLAGFDASSNGALESGADARAPVLDDSYTGFPGSVFDINATPNGNLLVAVTNPELFDGNVIQEIGRRGIADVTGLPVTGSGLNGLEPIGQRNFFATTGGLDLTVGAGLWRVSQGNARLVADIATFTMGDWVTDPSLTPAEEFHANDLENAGPHPEWKDFRCEVFAEFRFGPQTNPYHLTALSGSEVLIGDAANNGVLWAKTNGNIDVVAFMDPPDDPDNDGWMVLDYVDENGIPTGPGEDAIECYVEPVPTAVAIGPDGAYYVSELTGTTRSNFDGDASPEGLARVWRIEPGARNVVCPSADCVEAVTELNAVIDIEFGPDGKLYVVEFEKSGFLAAVAPDLNIDLAGGALKRCDVFTDECEVMIDGVDFLFPGAITFDKSDNLWLVENVFAPTVRQVDWQ